MKGEMAGGGDDGKSGETHGAMAGPLAPADKLWTYAQVYDERRTTQLSPAPTVSICNPFQDLHRR
jgi:hypothetical protein